MGGQPGLSMQDVVAFGDNYNDLSMLEAAGTGVAMGNAVDEVKARARVVIGDNESTSIAEFIYRQLL
jgi:hydroxymethylpyrimidine pyrophosphatase-like HAD family hydrolase